MKSTAWLEEHNISEAQDMKRQQEKWQMNKFAQMLKPFWFYRENRDFSD